MGDVDEGSTDEGEAPAHRGGTAGIGAVPLSLHPAVAGREAPLAALADAVRRLVELTVTNTAPAEVLDAVTARLGDAADRLAAEVPDPPPPRFAEPAAGAAEGSSMHASMPYDPVIGRFNPLALPVTMSWEPPMAVGTGIFTTPYEGAPGCVHGAAIAATFDIILAAANHLAGAAGPTVRLSMRFLRPTLLGVESRFEGEAVRRDRRRVANVGRLVQDGVVTVEVEGEYAVLDRSRIRRMGERGA